jgi:hypothetical protein
LTVDTEFLHDAGGCVASTNVLSGRAPLKWLNREQPIDPVDTGWRFASTIDDDAYLSDSTNLRVVDFNTIVGVEPAVLAVYSMPVGSDLQLVTEVDGRVVFYDNKTGSPLDVIG